MPRNGLSALFYLPSFYGLCAWVISFSLFHIPVVEWDPLSPLAYTIFFGVILAFFAGTVVSYRSMRELVISDVVHKKFSSVPASLWVVLVLHAIGFFGLAWHISELMRYFGSVPAFLYSLIGESHLIRQSEVITPGTQLTYFGWLGIWFAVIYLYVRPSRFAWLLKLMCFLQFAGNIVYIDRTRPLWILFVAVLLIMIFKRPSFGRLLRYCMIATVVVFGLFTAIAGWVGKVGDNVDEYGNVMLDGPVRVIYMYVTGGFPYFNYELASTQVQDVSLTQTFYPMAKVLAAAKITADPPSQVLPEVSVPFPMNVATFLDPYLQDGGLPYVLIGILLHGFAANWLALALLKSHSPLAMIGWANLCFMNAISFFVPKIVSLPMWIFVLPAIAVAMLRAIPRQDVVGPLQGTPE